MRGPTLCFHALLRRSSYSSLSADRGDILIARTEGYIPAIIPIAAAPIMAAMPIMGLMINLTLPPKNEPKNEPPSEATGTRVVRADTP